MEGLLKEFDLPGKNPPTESLLRWRKAVSWVVVKNRRRRYRFIADLDKRSKAEGKRRKIQEKIRVALYVQKAALQFIEAGSKQDYKVPEYIREAGFSVHPDELASIVHSHDMRKLEAHGGVVGICDKLRSSTSKGINPDSAPVRQDIFGENKYDEKPPRPFWKFVLDSFHDLTLIILMFCAAISVTIGLAAEGWPTGIFDGLGIFISIFLVVMVTSISDYKQSLQFRDLDREKKNISVQVTRNDIRQKISIYDLVVGDVVHLSIGDQVPVDGLYISGYSLVIDESSLSGESEPVHVSQGKPFLLAGTKVQDGSAKMLVTSVGMKTEWGRIMETLNQGGEDETPLQVKLNGVATIIGKIGLFFAIITFLVLFGRFIRSKAVHEGLKNWTLNDATQILNSFAICVTIIVVAVPEGLPLAVTLSLAFAMKKLMDQRALVRHLAACETMGSASCICTDKTGTLTTNHMVVSKIWICEVSKSTSGEGSKKDLSTVISEDVLNTLLQCIFQNTGSEVVRGKDGASNILGTPTEAALLEFGLNMGGDFDAQRRECKIIKMEPFNSVKKKMSVLVKLKDGRSRAFCKGAPEIILQMCDRFVDKSGYCVPLSDKKASEIMHVIESFACEALRTLCVAFKDVHRNFGDEDIPSDGYTLVAVLGIKDPVRPGVKEAVQACIAAGITVRMVTGDNINTAKAIARECGILTENGLAIEGPDFRNKSTQEMKELIPNIQVMKS